MEHAANAATRWSKAPPPLPSGYFAVPNPWHVLCLRVKHAFWNVLAFERDNMETEAEEARQHCIHVTQALRAQFDPHPELGPEAADAMIAWQVKYARAEFAEELRRETEWIEKVREYRASGQPLPPWLDIHRPMWRYNRGAEKSYF